MPVRRFVCQPSIPRQTLGRGDLIKLQGQGDRCTRLERCAFDGEDLSELDLRGIEFFDCTFDARALLGYLKR